MLAVYHCIYTVRNRSQGNLYGVYQSILSPLIAYSMARKQAALAGKARIITALNPRNMVRNPPSAITLLKEIT